MIENFQVSTTLYLSQRGVTQNPKKLVRPVIFCKTIEKVVGFNLKPSIARIDIQKHNSRMKKLMRKAV